uniref:Uncharacterized protein n=1 Tax=Marmota marmota marmota TaxID=9994 RepID=A0A8C5Z9K4_MARMA
RLAGSWDQSTIQPVVASLLPLPPAECAANLPSFWDNRCALPHLAIYFFLGSHYVGQCGLEFLNTSGPFTSSLPNSRDYKCMSSCLAG